MSVEHCFNRSDGVSVVRYYCDFCGCGIGPYFSMDAPPFTRPRLHLGMNCCSDCAEELIRCGVTIPMPETLAPV